MAGAVTHTWPENIRAAIVTACIDEGMSQGKAVRQAQAGELPNCPALRDTRPGRSTVAGWVANEQAKRNRLASEIVNTTGLFDAVEQALANLLTPVIEDANLAAQGKRGKLTDADAKRIRRNIAVLKQACPEAGRRTRATPQPEAQNGKRKRADGEGSKASTLAERLAARANTTTDTQAGTQRETGAAQTTATQPDHEDSESDPVVGGHVDLAGVAA